MLSEELPLEQRRQILRRAVLGLLPYMRSRPRSRSSRRMRRSVICAAMAVAYYALPLASGTRAPA